MAQLKSDEQIKTGAESRAMEECYSWERSAWIFKRLLGTNLWWDLPEIAWCFARGNRQTAIHSRNSKSFLMSFLVVSGARFYLTVKFCYEPLLTFHRGSRASYLSERGCCALFHSFDAWRCNTRTTSSLSDLFHQYCPWLFCLPFKELCCKTFQSGAVFGRDATAWGNE